MVKVGIRSELPSDGRSYGPCYACCCMTRRTGSGFCFVEAPGLGSDVVEWFRRMSEPPEETPTAHGMVLYFRGFGPLAYNETGAIDVARSPVVSIVLPTVRREILWTVGEVNFLSTLSLPQNRQVKNVVRSFATWLRGHQRVYEQSPKADNPLAYYIEGSARNRGDIYALPSGMTHLQRGGYVVSFRDNALVVDRVCRRLRLRGVDCGPSDES